MLFCKMLFLTVITGLIIAEINPEKMIGDLQIKAIYRFKNFNITTIKRLVNVFARGFELARTTNYHTEIIHPLLKHGNAPARYTALY